MPIRARMLARDIHEDHRASTPLELFFDLVFVIAVGQASTGLHHGLVEGPTAKAVGTFLLVFFAIWWAWMGFTWFASAYDTDDVPYRLAVFVIMVGVLILAAGVARVFAGSIFGVIAVGYAVMRLALVALWLRAAYSFPEGRPTALRYAIGITVLQLFWFGRLALPESVGLASFLVLALFELALPLWAEAAGPTNWHPGHIAERYGLFTIIVLGESVLSATLGVQDAMNSDTGIGELLPTIVGGLAVVFAMWWIYFDRPAEPAIEQARTEVTERGRGLLLWAYGHYVVFASAAATGAGLAVVVDHATGHGHLSDVAAGLAITVPVAAYLLSVWVLYTRYHLTNPTMVRAAPVAAVVILASSFAPHPVLITGVALIALIVTSTITSERAPVAPAE